MLHERRHVQQVADTVASEMLTHMHFIVESEPLNGFANFIEFNPRFTNTDGLVEGLLGDGHNVLDFGGGGLFLPTIDHGQIGVPVESVKVGGHIHIDLVS